MDKADLLWRQYQLNVDLFRSYLELSLKFNLFYYATTGALLSFYFTHPEQPLVKYSLLLPVAMSLAFACFFGYGAVLTRHIRDEIFRIRDALGLEVAPDAKVLALALWLFAALLGVVSVALLWLLACH